MVNSWGVRTCMPRKLGEISRPGRQNSCVFLVKWVFVAALGFLVKESRASLL